MEQRIQIKMLKFVLIVLLLLIEKRKLFFILLDFIRLP